MTPDIRDRLRELANAATPGPWFVERVSVHEGAHRYHIDGVLRWRNYLNALDCMEDEATAEYIAAAGPDVMLALLDEREALIAEYERMENEMDSHAQHYRCIPDRGEP